MSTSFTLYATPLSANGRKVLAVSQHVGLTPEIRLVDVYRGEGRTAEYLAINPSGKIPALVEGDFTLTESNAILQYLCEAHGDCRLWSREAKARGAIARWLFWESAHWQPVLTSAVGIRRAPAAAQRRMAASRRSRLALRIVDAAARDARDAAEDQRVPRWTAPHHRGLLRGGDGDLFPQRRISIRRVSASGPLVRCDRGARRVAIDRIATLDPVTGFFHHREHGGPQRTQRGET